MGTTNLQPIQLFGIGTFARSANITRQERVNLYTEVSEDSETLSHHLHGTPGLVLEFDLGASPSRGAYSIGVSRYVVNANRLFKIANNNTFTIIGTLLTSSGRVDMRDNGLQLMIVDGPNGYILTIATDTLVRITDPDFPGGDTVDFLNGYFIVNKPNTGQFFISELYNGMNWDALDFATAESNPDLLIRVFVNNGILMLFGEKTTEFWSDSGALDFPFARIGAAAVEWGLAARWSLTKFEDSVIFLGKNRLGGVQVFKMEGGGAVPVSTSNLDYILAQYSRAGQVSNATGLCYMVAGHSMYQLNFPSQNVTWTYDGKIGEWHKLQSGVNRHLADIQYNHQENSFVTSYLDGKGYKFDDLAYTDNGETIIREIYCRHQLTGNWSVFDELWLELQAGTGIPTGQGVNPQVMMQYSKDGGHTWSQEIWVPMGKIGQTRVRAVWRRLGRARDWVMKFRVTDPVKVSIVSAWGRASG